MCMLGKQRKGEREGRFVDKHTNPGSGDLSCNFNEMVLTVLCENTPFINRY